MPERSGPPYQDYLPPELRAQTAEDRARLLEQASRPDTYPPPRPGHGTVWVTPPHDDDVWSGSWQDGGNRMSEVAGSYSPVEVDVKDSPGSRADRARQVLFGVVVVGLSVAAGIYFVQPAADVGQGTRLAVAAPALAGATVVGTLGITRAWGARRILAVPLTVSPFAVTIFIPLILADALGSVAWVFLVIMAILLSLFTFGVIVLLNCAATSFRQASRQRSE
ncbi:hypothetical protein GTR02_01235 [Kineococcus sp. R8]|uniref:hypothetical protein n=1 Tax=Kineococcus siccus TaxID=2696567 RepID=UPI0014125300|nr:hypothetical protein [Kineococcus siccus]NAZ80442.1 hypothetical protein [Kineococcus siccus]